MITPEEQNQGLPDTSHQATEKLTTWVNAPELTALQQELTDSKSAHDAHVSQVGIWLDNLHTRGKAKTKAKKGHSAIDPKVIRKQAEWRYTSLSEPFLSTEDIFNVYPTTHLDKEAANQNALILNNQFNTKMDKVDFIDEYVRTAVDEGTVIIRVGWKEEVEVKDVEVPIFSYVEDPSYAPAHEELHQLMTTNNQMYVDEVPAEIQEAHRLTMKHGVPMRPEPAGTETKEQSTTVANHPTAEICDYRNLVIDPTAHGNMKKAQFVIYNFETNLSELKKESVEYSNLDKILLDSASPLTSPDHMVTEDHNFNFLDDPRKKVIVHEYWGYYDIHNKGTTVPIVASWVGNTLIRMEENPFPDKKIPFIKVQYLPQRRHTYGEPDGALLEDNQKVIGAVVRGMVDIMGRGANGQTGIRKDALDVTNRRRYDNGEDYEFNGVDPRMAFYQHTFSEIPRSAEVMLGYQNQEAESLTGQKVYNEGINAGSLGESTGNARRAMDAASKRELGILRRLAGGVVELGRKMISMNAVFMDEEEVVRITDEEFVTVKRDDLAGSMDLRLVISTAEEDDSKASELSFMLQTMGPTMPPEIVYPLMADIARLRKMPDTAKRLDEYRPEPDPMDVMLKELEIAKVQAEILEIQGRTFKQNTGGDLDIAKGGTEAARARNLDSQTDMNNLDFVEQEGGTKQERDLESIREQGAERRRGDAVKDSNQPRKDNAKGTRSS